MANNNHWTANDIPDQSGRVAVVTGANSGLGYEASLVLAQKGAAVIMTSRDLNKGRAALNRIQNELPAGSVVLMPLDLADLESVREFASRFSAQFDVLDLLINNAGVMMAPLGRTAQGVETQFGINHLGHFLLTGMMLDGLRKRPGGRAVTVSSLMHRIGRIDTDDLDSSKGYSSRRAYGRSKLANLSFTYELDRRLKASGNGAIANAAHPGWAATRLQRYSSTPSFMNQFLAQSAVMGALPILRAATDPLSTGGQYYGPNRRMETAGYPVEVRSNGRSYDLGLARELWDASEELAGFTYDLPQPSW